MKLVIEFTRPLTFEPNEEIISRGTTNPDITVINSSNNEKEILIIAFFFLTNIVPFHAYKNR